MLFAKLPEPFTKALNVVRPKLLQVGVTLLNEDGHVVMRLDSQEVSTTCYKSRSLLVYLSGWTKPEIGVKRRRSQPKRTKHVENTVKKRKTGTSPLEIRADAGPQEMTEEDVVDYSEPAPSSTLSNEGRTAMSKRLNAMAPFCPVCDVDFRNFVEEHKLIVRVNRTGKVDLVLADPPSDIW